MADTYTVLIVEEDPAMLGFLTDNLRADGFSVVGLSDPARALLKCATDYPDAAIVSVNGGSGRQIVQSIRAGHADVDHRLPVLLTGKDRHELETIRNLNVGADDYVPKPFSYPELHARLAALMRRVELDSPAGVRVLHAGAIRMDTGSRLVTVDGTPVELSKKEYLLLLELIRDPQRVLTKDELMRKLWGRPNHASTRTLDSHVCRLRNKLHRGAPGERTRFLHNVWGVGYRLLTESAPA